MSLKVLIADPDWRFSQQASSFLESHAHLVVRESQAQQVLAQAEHWRPDLVIVAAELVETAPDLMGSLYRLKPRPAVLLTGWLDRFDRIWRAWQEGGDELLIKPVLKSLELHMGVVTALENAATGARQRRGAAVPMSA
jgi:PleD family two-component response regulator